MATEEAAPNRIDNIVERRALAAVPFPVTPSASDALHALLAHLLVAVGAAEKDVGVASAKIKSIGNTTRDHIAKHPWK